MKPGQLSFYFHSAFPSSDGFSGYRMPGPLVHLAVTALFVALGAAICLPGMALATAPLVCVWVVAGFYLGRDLTVLSHYHLALGLAVIGMAAVALIGIGMFPEAALALYRDLEALSAARYPEAAFAATAIVAAGFALWVYRASALLFEDSG